MSLIDELRSRRRERTPELIAKQRSIPVEDRLARSAPYQCVWRGEAAGQVSCGVAKYPCYHKVVDSRECVVTISANCDDDPAMLAAATRRLGLAICDQCPHRERSRGEADDESLYVNPGWPRRHDVPAAVLEPVRIVQLSGFQQAQHHLNGAITRFREQDLLLYRFGWGAARLHLARLAADFTPYEERDISFPTTPDSRVGQEDPRVFHWQGRLWVAYTGVHRAGGRLRTTVMLGELDEQLLPRQTWSCHVEGRRSWEKNWSFFAMGEELFAVYDIAPHRVVHLSHFDDETATAHFVWRYTEEWQPPAELGLLRGGASPAYWQGEWYAFAHGVYLREAERHYQLVAYTFEQHPPFRPQRVIRGPLLVADPAERPARHVPHCVYPCGAVRRDNQWLISYGYYDKWVRLAGFDVHQVEQRLEVLPGAELVDVHTPLDRIVWKQVYHGNEYRLPTRFEDGDLVVDIGAHIGSFTCAALERGATVLAYEQAEVFARCWRANVARFAGDATLQVAAVGQIGNYHAPPRDGVRIERRPLPDRPVRLVKLDVEGAEFTILREVDFSRVLEVCGEGHDIAGTAAELAELLHAQGFGQISMERNGDTTWLFWARR